MLIHIAAPFLRTSELLKLSELLREAVDIAMKADVELSPQYVLSLLAIVNHERVRREHQCDIRSNTARNSSRGRAAMAC